MLAIKKEIESVMTGRDRFPGSPFALTLHMLSIGYGVLQSLRAAGYRKKIFPSRQLPCKVISVGNITVGGTGKTPMTIYLAREIKQAGRRVAIVSRGYKGGAERRGGVVANGTTICMDPLTAGDEPYMMACRLEGIPVIVGRNRFAAGLLAIDHFQPDVIVLDDAFQHLMLRRDIDLVLIDAMHPFGNGRMLPRGTLREPIAALGRASACILTRSNAAGAEALAVTRARVKLLVGNRPIFESLQDPYFYLVPGGEQTTLQAVPDFPGSHDLVGIKSRKVFGFSGIARNEDFQRTVKDLGFNVTGFLEFPDHYFYSAADQKKIMRVAEESGAQRLITTEKDHVRLVGSGSWNTELVVVGVKASFRDGGQGLRSFIQARL